LKHANKMLADKEAKVQRLTSQAKGKGGQPRSYNRGYGDRDYGGRDNGGRSHEAEYGRPQYDDRNRERGGK
jgi:hypothetical protein